MSHYELGDRLGVGGFGVVHEARRVEDGLKVAVKDVMKTNDMEYLNIPDHPNPLPLEIALTFLANKGPTAPGIIKLLDWQDQRDNYVMVLECPSPCENLASFLEGHGDRLNEGLVRHIMRQVTQAARTSCRRGVFHGDVKLENFIVSKNTLEVKLIDFGCGDLMRKSAYTTLYGTLEYYPPEYRIKGKYHGESAMSWSLGVVLFTMLCGRFPTGEDLQKTELNLWSEPGLSEDCCRLVCNLLQPKPKRRLCLGEILCHDWFKVPSLRSSSLHLSRGRPPAPRHLQKVSCQLCVLRAGRKAFHPSGSLCVLRGPAGHGCVLRHGLKQQKEFSALRLAGWQEGFPSLRKPLRLAGPGRPWLRLAPWPKAAVLASCGLHLSRGGPPAPQTSPKSLLSALRLAGWQEGFLSLRKPLRLVGPGRPWLRLAPWPEAAELASGGSARLGMCMSLSHHYLHNMTESVQEVHISSGLLTRGTSHGHPHLRATLPWFVSGFSHGSPQAKTSSCYGAPGLPVLLPWY
ncbi:serine/threonine-protein kinase pim-2-like [Garra rufa]|uniref:serine/threonine-protein kinase pim-2-like n=1 Tax=Garra rufa TaxID=137080 RepID=UPI003CCEBDAB